MPGDSPYPAGRVEVVASDAATGMLEFARGRAEQEEAHADGRLSFTVGSAEQLPLPSGSFDLALSSFVLQLVLDRLTALTEIRRVLRPGGMLAYVTWLDGESREPFGLRLSSLIEAVLRPEL